MSDGIGSKVKMRNAFRYLKLTAALALILNFGLFFNRLIRHFVFPNLQILKTDSRYLGLRGKAWGLASLCITTFKKRYRWDPEKCDGNTKSLFIQKSSRLWWILGIFGRIEASPKNTFQIIARKCFIKGSTMDWCAKRISLARMFSYLGRTCHHTGLCQGGAGKGFWWQEFSLIISKSLPKKGMCCQVGWKWASSIFRWDRLSSFNRGQEVDFTWLVVEKN